MKLFQALIRGVLVGVQVFLFFLIPIFLVVVVSNYLANERDFLAYFTPEIFIGILSHPLNLILLSLLVILSCANQLLKLKRKDP